MNNVKYPECLLCSFDPSTLTLSWTYVNVGSVAVRSGTCRKERDVHYFIRKDTVGVNSLFGHADPYQLEQQFWLRRQLRGQLRQRRQRLPFYLLLQAWWIVLFVRSVGSKDERLYLWYLWYSFILRWIRSERLVRKLPPAEFGRELLLNCLRKIFWLKRLIE